MSKTNIMQSPGGTNCPQCDEWIRQPEDPSVTSVSCPSCGADVPIKRSATPAAAAKKSGGILKATLLCASLALILGIYGYSIYEVKSGGNDLVLAPPRPVETTVAPPTTPEAPAPEPAPEPETLIDAGEDPDEESKWEMPGLVPPASGQEPVDAPPGMAVLVEMLDPEEDIEDPDSISGGEVAVTEPETPTAEEPPATLEDETPIAPPVATLEDEIPVAPPVATPVFDEPEPAPPEDPLAGEIDTPADVQETDVPEPPEVDPSELPVIEGELEAFDEEAFLAGGWKTQASEVLSGFMASTDYEQMSGHVIEPERVSRLLRALQREPNKPWAGLSAGDFNHVELSDADRDRGIFLMLREVSGEDPATAATRSYAFFRRTDDGLKLDLETFVQTTSNSFQRFVAHPQPGLTRVFRVFITEDPTTADAADANHRSFIITGLANFNAAARIRITNESPVGRMLASVAFTADGGSRRIMRNATVELRWTDQPENSNIELSRFICWEFLGLGGQMIEDDPTPQW